MLFSNSFAIISFWIMFIHCNLLSLLVGSNNITESQMDFMDEYPIILFRHSKRRDTVGDKGSWSWYEQRPYDTPITIDSILNIKKETQIMQQQFSTIDNIISSPFLRCVQTAIVIAQFYSIPKITIDYKLFAKPDQIDNCFPENMNDECKEKQFRPFSTTTYFDCDRIQEESIEFQFQNPQWNNTVSIECDINAAQTSLPQMICPVGISTEQQKLCNQFWSETVISEVLKITQSVGMQKHTLVVTHGEIMKQMLQYTNLPNAQAIKVNDCSWIAIPKNIAQFNHKDTLSWPHSKNLNLNVQEL